MEVMGLSHEADIVKMEVVFWSGNTEFYWDRNGNKATNIWTACHLEIFPEPLARGTVVNKYQEEKGNLHFKCGGEPVVPSSLEDTQLFHTHGNCSNLEEFST